MILIKSLLLGLHQVVFFTIISILLHPNEDVRVAAESNIDFDNVNVGDDIVHDDECAIYMAQSSIPKAGFGLYTTNPIPKGQYVLPYADAPSIPVCDRNFNDLTNDLLNHVSYFWSGDGMAEFLCDFIEESVVTFGAISNYHTVLHNVDAVSNGYDDTLVDRNEDPTAGSFSYLNGHSFKATQDIPAGGEIFADYGETWLDARRGTFADFVPRSKDFEIAVTILEKLVAQEKDTCITKEMIQVAGDTTDLFSPRAAMIIKNLEHLNDTLDEFMQGFKNLTTDESKMKELAMTTVVKRDMNWIRENGVCMTKIKPDTSTITIAGRGAFAQVNIEKGDIVVPAPLLNIVDRDKMIMYEEEDNDDDNYEFETVPDFDSPLGYQLLMNYCFGHMNSKLLVCPQSAAININHCSTRTRNNGEEYGSCGPDGPNAKLKWASGWDPDTEDWLKMSINLITDLTAEGSRGLSMEIVALRDIQPGEEIFIDYGKNWEKAWETHVEKWVPYTPDDYIYEPLKSISDIRTLSEQETNPYPENIQTICYFDYEDVKPSVEPEDEDMDDGYEYVDEMDGEEFITKYGIEREKSVYPCEIVDRFSTTYSVRIIQTKRKVYIADYPMESVTLRMKRYTSDQDLYGSFRHFIEIDDDIFPEEWKTEPDWENIISYE
mmetsp:Transcript_28070/g.32733  ORF Transcript_28070/g.32733 Transcript_28070/m.32733 type:complete len:660 (+) Transcript_28070:84-2063(+)